MRIAPPDILAARLERLRASLVARSLDAIVITSLPNLAYLTGLFASAGAAVAGRENLILIGDSRYAEALNARAHEWPAIRPLTLPAGVSFDAAIVDAVAQLAGLRVGFEARQLTVARHRFLTRTLGQRGHKDELVETDGIVEELRVTKDRWEVGRLHEGGARLSEVAKCILPKVLAGRTEADVAADIDAALRRSGFERPAFDTIVASGPNAALPHARAGDRPIGPGELVVLDFGGVLDGYCTDLSRTVVAGPAGDRERKLIERVIAAQQAAFAATGPGVAPEDVDLAARESLAREGLAEAFTHGTGHGLGLEIHEAPRVTRRRADHTEPALAVGTVMTLEPGAYIPGWGGVRIEDDVLVTDGGAEWLTDVPRTTV
jgi:Xaa-Pro aminopeptidase